MSISIADFWKVLEASRLLAPEQVQQLAAEFGLIKGAGEQASGKTAAEWLVTRNVLSRYQATILRAGRPGPFYYGEYKVYDRVEGGRLSGQFRAIHAPTGHPVLLRFLTGPVVGDPQRWAAAAYEAQGLAGIVSPHVARIFETVDLQTFKFFVTEDLRGEALEQRLAVGRFQPAEAARIARLAAIGLAQMHQCGRTYGDVRPANVLLEPAPNHPGNVKLLLDPTQPPIALDFSQQQAGSRLAQQADYLAPELATPGRAPDPLTDVYALGCTLYTMLAGQPPFAGGDIAQKMARHAAEAIRPLEMWGVPQPLAQIVAYLMAKNPAVRFQSAAQAAEQLAALVDPAIVYAQPPLPPATLASFEYCVRQRQSQPAEQAPPPASPPVAPGALAPAAEPHPLDFRSNRRNLGALVSAAAESPSPASPAVSVTPAAAVAVKAPPRPAGNVNDKLRRREADQKRNLIIGLAVTGIVVLGGVIGFAALRNGSRPLAGNAASNLASPVEGGPTESEPGLPVTPISTNNSPGTPKSKTPDTTPPVTPPPVTPMPRETSPAPVQPADAGGGLEIVPDDGQSLWASPTTGPPVTFRGVPPEAQLIVIVRPSDILAAPEGQRVMQALGPTLATQQAAWESAAGVKLYEIERLIVSLHNNDGKFPRTSFVVKTKQPIARDQLLARWGNPAAAQEKDETYYTGSGWAYYLSAAPEDERTFSMGQARDIQEVAAAAGAPPVLFREMERLRRTTDAQRHFTLLFYPQFLFSPDGAPLLSGERAKVRQPLEWLLGDHLQGAAVSGQFADEFYFELRMLSSLDQQPVQLAEELRSRLNQAPAALEDYFVALNPPAYWKKLAFRYPGMVRGLHGQMRVGVENEQAIVNSVLPGAAAHNLVLGGELLVATTPGGAALVDAPPAGAAPKTFDDALKVKTSYSFDNQSLEFAMRDLAADVQSNLKGAPFEFAIKIIGPDLQADGITRNQSIRDFKQENQTVADILTALVLKANPIPGQAPSNKDQKLIWVVATDPDSGKPAVLITTRAAAATKKYTLPTPLALKP